MNDDYAVLIKDLAKHVMRERRRANLSVETVDAHMIQCVINYLNQQRTRYLKRKELEVSFNQVQNVYNYIVSMRWLGHFGLPKLSILESNIRKVTQKFNFHPEVIDTLCTSCRDPTDDRYLDWILFLSYCTSMCSFSAAEAITNSFHLFSVDGVIANIEDLNQILLFYANIDVKNRDYIHNLAGFVVQEAEMFEGEVKLSRVLENEFYQSLI